MKVRDQILIIALAFGVGCSSDKTFTDVEGWKFGPDTSVEDVNKKDVVTNDTSDDFIDGDRDQNMSNVCESPDGGFQPGINLEELEGCEIVLSPILFVDYFEAEIMGLDSLREMGPKANLSFNRNPDLLDIDTLANLEIVKRSLSMNSLPKLRDLTGFRSLRRVESRFSLTSMAIKNFDGLQNLEFVGELGLRLAELESFDGLENLTEISGNISLSAPKITEIQFRDFLKGKAIGGEILFQGEPFTP